MNDYHGYSSSPRASRGVEDDRYAAVPYMQVGAAMTERPPSAARAPTDSDKALRHPGRRTCDVQSAATVDERQDLWRFRAWRWARYH